MILINFVGIPQISHPTMDYVHTDSIWTGWLESSHKHTVETLAALPKHIA